MTSSDIVPERLTSDQIDNPDPNVKQHLTRYNFASRFTQDMEVLDIACGEGYGSKILVTDGKAKKVVGCDVNEEVISNARKRYNYTNLEFRIMDGQNIGYPSKSFDRITSFETIEHVNDFSAMMAELSRVMKDSGMLFISTPNKKYSLGNNEFHLKEFYAEEFERELSKFFKKVDMYFQGNGETFGRIITTLHIRRYIKKIRGDKVYDVKKLQELGSDIPAVIFAVCRK